MKLDIKSFLIGALVTINALMLYSFNSENNIEHKHSSEEITYSSYGYGGYGTLKSKIKEMEDDIDDSADDNHDHYYDYSRKNHTHSSYEIY